MYAVRTLGSEISAIDRVYAACQKSGLIACQERDDVRHLVDVCNSLQRVQVCHSSHFRLGPIEQQTGSYHCRRDSIAPDIEATVLQRSSLRETNYSVLCCDVWA